MKNMKTTATVFHTWATLISITQSAKILTVSPYPSRSYFTFNNAILKPLLKAGHEITIITQFAKESAEENFTSVIDISDGEFKYVSQIAADEFLIRSSYDWQDFFAELEFSLCERVLNLKEIQSLMKSTEKQFDAMIFPVFNHHTCYYQIAKKLNIPVIGTIPQRSWFVPDLEISNPRHPLLIPMEIGTDVIPNNLMNRVKRVLDYMKMSFYWYTLTDNVYEKYRNDVKPAVVFVNSHSSYFPRPMNPNVIEIGGIQMDGNRPLPKDIQNFLDGAEHDAILFSLGSMLRAAKIPKHKVKAFKDAFAEIPQRVIWKYEEEMEEVPPNVMLMKWLPQTDILAHKKIKAFISHCGQGAVHESLHHAVPLISCPIFMDQRINARIFENLEIAVHLDYETITKESILKAVNEVINNTKYYEKMQKLSHAFKDRPMSPQQAVVYWTEYVIKHEGAPHLKSPAMELNWFQYLLLDVIGFLILIMALILYVTYFICKLTYSRIALHCNKTVKNKSD